MSSDAGVGGAAARVSFPLLAHGSSVPACASSPVDVSAASFHLQFGAVLCPGFLPHPESIPVLHAEIVETTPNRPRPQVPSAVPSC